MINYFEKMTFVDLVKFPFIKKNFFTEVSSDIYYFNITRLAAIALPFFNSFRSQKILRLDFEMISIRADNNELQRLKIYREDIVEFSDQLEKSEVLNKFRSHNNNTPRLHSYLTKGVVDGEISVDGSVNRSLYIITVVKWHLDLINAEAANLILQNRTWAPLLETFATRQNINLKIKRNLFLTLRTRLKVFLSLSYYPRLYFILKNLKYLSSDRIIHKPTKPTIFVDGRGDLHFKNDGKNSDFFWEMNSTFDKSRIVYKYLTADQKKQLHNYGVLPVSGSARFRNVLSIPKVKKRRGLYSIAKDEYSELNHMIRTYRSNFAYWRSFFKKYNTKVYFSWYKFDNSHMAVADALQSEGGISILWQMALNAIQESMCKTDTDILLSYSSHCAGVDKKISSNYNYNIITGYPKDYAKNFAMGDAYKIRNLLKSNGAKNIVCVLDENSLDDSRWHTGHKYQIENYSFILENLLRDKHLGVIFKPKRSIDLRKRIGEEVWSMLEKAKDTGRCYIFDETIGFTTLSTPIVACLASDLCIHSHLCAGTAGLESALAGIPTILIDREFTPASILNDLPKDHVVFNNWCDAIAGMNEYFSSKNRDKEFGNWSLILDDLDPFQDGLAAQRIGDLIESLFEGFKNNYSREEIMMRSVEKYAKKWGSDKIIEPT